MAINRDFKDLFSAFCADDVRFLMIGAHAVMYYTVPRYTKDLDIWIDPTPENAGRAYRALARFGAPLEGVSVEDLHTPGTILGLLQIDDLIASKKAAGRLQDQLDLEWLEKRKRKG